MDSSLSDTLMEEYRIYIYKTLTDLFVLPCYESGQAGSLIVADGLRTGSSLRQRPRRLQQVWRKPGNAEGIYLYLLHLLNANQISGRRPEQRK